MNVCVCVCVCVCVSVCVCERLIPAQSPSASHYPREQDGDAFLTVGPFSRSSANHLYGGCVSFSCIVRIQVLHKEGPHKDTHIIAFDL